MLNSVNKTVILTSHTSGTFYAYFHETKMEVSEENEFL